MNCVVAIEPDDKRHAFGVVERINITLPARVLRRIDQAAKQAGESPSAYLARRALA